MTALSDIKSIPDLINFIWERDDNHDWELSSMLETGDISKDALALIDTNADGRINGAELAAYRHLPVKNSLFLGNNTLLPISDTKICNQWFKGGKLFETHLGGYSGVLARDAQINGRVYKAGTAISVDHGAAKETQPPVAECTALIQDSILTDERQLIPKPFGNTHTSPREMHLPAGSNVCYDDAGMIDSARPDPGAPIRLSPLGGRFSANISRISYDQNANVYLTVDGAVDAPVNGAARNRAFPNTIRVPFKRIIERIEAVIPLSVRTLANFLPSSSEDFFAHERYKIEGGRKVYDAVSAKELVTKILDLNVDELFIQGLEFTYDRSGKPIAVSFSLVPSFDPSASLITLKRSIIPSSMPYFDKIIQIFDEELAAANPLPEEKTTAANESHPAAPTLAVNKPKGDGISPLPNLRLDASYLFGNGQRPAVGLEAGFKAVGIGGEYARVIPSGDAKPFNEWRANASYRWKPIPGMLGAAIFMGGRGRNDGANGETRVGMEFGARASAMLTSHWMVDLSPSYTVIKGANIFDLGGGVGYKQGHVGASLGYRGIFMDGASSHGPRAGLFVWF